MGAPSVRLVPMTWEEFDSWSARSVVGFAAQQVDSGLLPRREAAVFAERQFSSLLVDGLATPLHHFWTVEHLGAPVGHLWLRVGPRSSEVEAYVFDVELNPDARGRGLGRATMLAAEAAGRDLGATVVRLNVFGHNTPARRLYESLGYLETRLALAKRMRGVVDPGTVPGAAAEPDVELRAMTEDEYLSFGSSLRTTYAEDLARSGAVPAAEARREAVAELDRQLPRGPESEGHLLWTAVREDRPVGRLWVQVQARSDGLHAVAHHLHVDREMRGGGHGREIVRAAELVGRAHGVRSVEASVLAFQAPARRLCAQVGFEVTALTMVKRL